jgi:serine/threonine protein kinase, bacterial
MERPFSGLNRADGLAVDSAGNVYVADAENSRVLKLPAQ